MNKAATAVTVGLVGVVIGAGGWALVGPERGADTAAAPVSHAAPVKPSATPVKPMSAQQIADKMTAAGLVVTMVDPSADPGYIGDVGGKAYDVGISEEAGQKVSDSGINMFPNPEALTTWVGISKGLGGVAVVGDTWAVSLPTNATGDRPITARMAPRIAKALGGTVEQ